MKLKRKMSTEILENDKEMFDFSSYSTKSNHYDD